MRFKFTIIALFLFLSTYAQDFSFGKLSKDDFNNINIDTAAKAIVLQEYGLARIELGGVNNGLILRNYTHRRILILKKEGFEFANFSIPLYKGESNSQRDVIVGFKGSSFNLVDGKVIETDLDKKNSVTEKVSDRLSVEKVTFPDIKEGTIVEIKYTIESPFLYNLRSWNFQSFIPKVSSTFVTEIPEICIYNVSMKGTTMLTDRKSENYNTSMRTSTGDIHGTKTTYVMKDVPAFISEDYMTSPTNYLSAINFELARYSIPFGPSHDFSTSWENVNKQLLQADGFGRELNRKNIFKDILPTVIKSSETDLEKSKAIYNYIKSAIKWDKTNGMYATNGISKALEKKNGNVGDINLALTNALQAAGLKAKPVILSTRGNGFPSYTSPSTSDFNYVISMLELDSTRYFLDATDVNLPFGLIPFKCINFQGRIVESGMSDWVDLIASQKSFVYYDVVGDLLESGKFKGKLLVSRIGYAALDKRGEIKGNNSIEEYFEGLEEKTIAYKILNSKVSYVDTVDLTLIEEFDIEIEKFGDVKGNEISFSPFFVGGTTKNPFNLEERSYPVDLGSKIEERLSFVVNIPEGFTLTKKAKRVNLALPNRDGRYLLIEKEGDKSLEIQMMMSLNKPMFLPEEYSLLKEFFSTIIGSQKFDYTIAKTQ